MEQKVFAFLAENQLIKENSRVLVGVSGGPDSLALLHFLHRHQSLLKIKVMAVTVDHQLRGDASIEDVNFVHAFCEKLNIPCITKAVDVPAYKKSHQLGTQMAARTMRYDIYAKVLQQYADVLALGHHADDQIETFIMQITKTTSLQSLSGIPLKRPFASGLIIRPFLCVTKDEIEQYCEQHHLEPRIDASNKEMTYTRNRIRAEILPKLKKENPNMAMTVQHLVRSMQEDEAYITEEAKKLFPRLVKTSKKAKKAVISINEFQSYPVSLQRRLYRLTLDYLYLEIPEQLTYKHEMAFLTLLKQSGNKTLDFPKGCQIEKTYDIIRFQFIEQCRMSDSFEQTITDIPMQLQLPDGAQLTLTMLDEATAREYKEDVHTYLIPEEELVFPLKIRNRKPGDRMVYEGLDGSKKIKDIFIDEKIDRKDRDTWCLLTDANDTILWLIGLKKKPRKKVPHSGNFLLFKYLERDVQV